MTDHRPSRTPGQVLSIGAGAVLAAALVGFSGLQIVGATAGVVHHTDHLVYRDPPNRLQIDTANGDVAVVRGPNGVVTVDRRTTSSLSAPEPTAVQTGGLLQLRSHCAGLAGAGRCDASYVIHAPAGMSVTVRTGSGNASASGLDGAVDLRSGSGDVVATGGSGALTLQTGSGDITATGIAGGPLRLHTSSGSIDASDVRAGRVSAVTSSGDVGLAFSVSPTAVTATTSSGGVAVAVPHGPQLYDVAQRTGSGEATAAVRTDPSSNRHIDETTSSGDASVAYR